MLLVIYGHVAKNFEAFFVFTSPVKIPLFFAVTGYVFRDNRNLRQFFGKLFRRIMVPWLVLEMLPIVLLSPLNGAAYLLDRFLKIITGRSSWYIPCCIVAECIWYCIVRCCKGHSGAVCLVSMMCFVVGILLAETGMFDIFMIDRAFIVQVYILIGYLFKQWEIRIAKIGWPVLLAGSALYVLLCAVSMKVFPGQHMDIHNNVYYNLPYCMVLIYLGCLLAFSIAPRVKRFPGPLLYVGRNTLVIYICQGYVLEVFRRVGMHFQVNIQNGWIAVFVMVATCGVCCFVAWVIDRYLPELMGKRRSSAQNNAYIG